MLQSCHTMPGPPRWRRRSGRVRRVVHSAMPVAEFTVSCLRYQRRSHPDIHPSCSRAPVADRSVSKPAPQPLEAEVGLLGERSGSIVEPFSDATADNPGFDLRRYWSAILRYRWWVLLGTGLGLAGGFVAGRQLSPQYSVQATVWIDAPSKRQQDASCGPTQSWTRLCASCACTSRRARLRTSSRSRPSTWPHNSVRGATGSRWPRTATASR